MGLGPIGLATARLIHERPDLRLVGAVDIDPQLVGRDIANVVGLEELTGIEIVAGLSDVYREADIIVHTTVSHFPAITAQVVQILENGLDVVLTSEELSFPWQAHRQEADELDESREGSVVGTGVNPGFVMDRLPLFLTSICQHVDCVHVERAINASLRRGPFQSKIGSGLSLDAFHAQVASDVSDMWAFPNPWT